MKPLAEIMRPSNIDDMVGQKHIISRGTVIHNLLDNRSIINSIFYGPPGTGKTTLARIMSQYTDKKFYKINATSASIKDIQEIVSSLDNILNYNGVVLYVDEIQHFNKKQQQALLEFIEDGRIVLLASTTENPYFSIHKAILSRSTIFEFESLEREDIVIALNRAIEKLIIEGYKIECEEGALDFIADISGGDVRKAYTILELYMKSTLSDIVMISKERIEKLNQSNMKSDASGDEYYNLLSALQKSIRGSDANAAIHYLARLIKGGNLDAIIRRIGVIAAEDIGMAHPNALTVVNNGIDLCLKIGFPEASLILSELVIYLATLPKSNSAYLAIRSALEDLEKIRVDDIPKPLKDAHYSGAKNLGIEGYKYPHDYPNHYIDQEYMPKVLKDKKYYISQENKYEKSLENYWKTVKDSKRK
ncbi:MAG: replication-associated recombination protein A [Sarcina sp.]